MEPNVTMNKELQDSLSGDEILKRLMDGNERFLESGQTSRDLKAQVAATNGGQWPYAIVLSCIDSRVPVETVFDQGIGDVFVARVAGNFVNTDILGSMEYACKFAGSRLILVLGHTSCGAIKGAVAGITDGNLGDMLENIQPAIKRANSSGIADKSDTNDEYITKVVEENVHVTMDRIRKESEILRDLEEQGEILVRGAVYDVKTGRVSLI